MTSSRALASSTSTAICAAAAASSPCPSPSTTASKTLVSKGFTRQWSPDFSCPFSVSWTTCHSISESTIELYHHHFHFLTLTVVPEPSSETILNSSTKRLTPDKPIPKLRDVLNPSCKARSTSGIPGPASPAITPSPRLAPSSAKLHRIPPCWP